MPLTNQQLTYFKDVSLPIIQNEHYQSMKQFMQHASISTYEHSICVAYYSYYLMKKLRISCSAKSVIVGALLHDFYLYDWHHKQESHKWHGFHHPKKAKHNATQHYAINETEQHIIEAHMWPLTMRHFPSSKEAIIVNVVDKYVSLMESMHYRFHVLDKIKEYSDESKL